MRSRFAALIGSCVMPVLAACFAASTALATDRVPFRQEELDQMLAPIALYPDPLLSQILMASTYPLEVVQAARWSRANPALKGEAAVRAVESQDWDPSVKSLTAFPHLLQMMDEKLEWTERLGEAFLAQEADVMESVQALRRRAEAAGNLRSGEHMRVERDGDAIVIAPASPEMVYVPYYSPAVVYGAWPWPHHPPVFWAPPVHVVHAGPPLFVWGSGFVVSTGFFFGHCDWHRRHVIVHRHAHGHHARGSHPVVRHKWRHDPVHRRGVPFRSVAARQTALGAATAREAPGSGISARRTEVVRLSDMRQRRFDERRSGGIVRAAPPQGDRADRAQASPRRARTADAPAVRQRSERTVTSAPPPRSEPRASGSPRPDAANRRSRNEPRSARPPGQPRAASAPQALNRPAAVARGGHAARADRGHRAVPQRRAPGRQAGPQRSWAGARGGPSVQTRSGMRRF